MFKRRYPHPVATWFPFGWEDEGEWDFQASAPSSGLSVYEEEGNIIVEAALPGLSAKDVKVYREEGYILIEGQKKEEEKKERKYYRKASSSFCYRFPYPAHVEDGDNLEVTFKDGVMKIKFKKTKEQKRLIPIREE